MVIKMEEEIEDAVLVEDETMNPAKDVMEEYNPLDYMLSEEGKKSSGIVKAMNAVYMKQADGMKAAVDKMTEEDLPRLTAELDAIKERLFTFDEFADMKDFDPEAQNAKFIEYVTKERLASLSADTKACYDEFLTKTAEIASTQKIIIHYRHSFIQMDAITVRKNNVIAILQLLPLMFDEILNDVDTNNRRMVYANKVLKAEYDKDKVKDYRDVIVNTLKINITKAKKKIDSKVPGSLVSGDTVARLGGRLGAHAIEGVDPKFAEYTNLLDLCYSLCISLLLEPNNFKFENEHGTIRKTPDVSYEAKFIQIIDILSIPSMSSFRDIAILEIADIIEAYADRIPLFKEVIKFMNDKTAWLKENKPEVYAAKMKGMETYDADVQKLHSVADEVITDAEEAIIKDNLKDIVKDTLNKYGVDVPDIDKAIDSVAAKEDDRQPITE